MLCKVNTGSKTRLIILGVLVYSVLVTAPSPGMTNYPCLTANAVFDDPLYSGQWALPHMGVPAAWEVMDPIFKRTVTIAVIDTGVNINHPDLQDKLLPGRNFVDATDDVSDLSGHGTAVTGAIVAVANNGIGLVGVVGDLDIKVLPLKAASHMGSMSFGRLVEAIGYAIEQKADIINISFGTPTQSKALEAAVQDAIEAGIVVVASAGNSGSYEYMYPASYPGVISVGAVSKNGNVASWSNRNDRITVVAPGEAIYTTARDGEYVSMTGTSVAASLVSGVAGMLRVAYPELTPSQIYDLLISTATDLGDVGYDIFYGHGLVNAYLLLMPGSIKGVVNYATPEGLPGHALDGISVELVELARAVRTDSYGVFSFADIPAGDYTLHFSSSLYVGSLQDTEVTTGIPTVIKAQAVKLGDVNLDGYVNAADIVPLNRHALGIQYITHPVALLAADVNGDGIVNAADIVLLNRHALGIERIH